MKLIILMCFAFNLQIIGTNRATKIKAKIGKSSRFISVFYDQGLHRVEFILYTPINPKINPFKFKINVTTEKLIENGYNISIPTKILAHGWRMDGDNFCGDFYRGKTLLYTVFQKLVFNFNANFRSNA